MEATRDFLPACVNKEPVVAASQRSAAPLGCQLRNSARERSRSAGQDDNAAYRRRSSLGDINQLSLTCARRKNACPQVRAIIKTLGRFFRFFLVMRAPSDQRPSLRATSASNPQWSPLIRVHVRYSGGGGGGGRCVGPAQPGRWSLFADEQQIPVRVQVGAWLALIGAELRSNGKK